MRIAPQDRPKVKIECLRLLATLRLDPARTQLISGFVDTYLRLNATEERVFQSELDTMGLKEEEQVMQIVTSWMDLATQKLVLRQLNRRVGTLEPSLEERIRELPLDRLEALGEDLLDFSDMSDLVNWLEQAQ